MWNLRPLTTNQLEKRMYNSMVPFNKLFFYSFLTNKPVLFSTLFFSDETCIPLQCIYRQSWTCPVRSHAPRTLRPSGVSVACGSVGAQRRGRTLSSSPPRCTGALFGLWGTCWLARLRREQNRTYMYKYYKVFNNAHARTWKSLSWIKYGL